MFQQDFHAYPYQDNSPDDLGKVMYTATELTTDINPDQRKGKCDTGNNYRGRNHRHVEFINVIVGLVSITPGHVKLD